MNAPLISILMPCRNARHTIEDALSSVERHMKCVSHEVVIADGGSTDGTREWLRSADIRLLEKADRSLYEGLNNAVAQARGDYVLWLNADDELAEGVVALAEAAGSRDWDMVTGEARMRDASRVVWQSTNADRQITPQSLLFGIPTINSRLIRRQLLLDLGGFRDDIGLAADRDLLIRMLPSAKARFAVPEVAYIYGVHEGSRTIAGTWRSYRAVHEANLEWAAAIASGHGAGQPLRHGYVAATHVAAARANLMEGRPLRAARHAMAGALHPIDLARGVRHHRQWRGRSSGW